MGGQSGTRVIVGIQESIAGLRALRLAVAETRQRGAVLHAVRVRRPVPLASGTGVALPPSESVCEAQDEVFQAFAAAMGRVPADIEVFIIVKDGEPGAALTAHADRDDDLLVVGVGRRGLVRRLFSGSVARYCLSHAACPVLAVPPDQFSQSAQKLARALHRDLSQLSSDTPPVPPASLRPREGQSIAEVRPDGDWI
jgi:nucleotide-binding universal stress UspA family protein